MIRNLRDGGPIYSPNLMADIEIQLGRIVGIAKNKEGEDLTHVRRLQSFLDIAYVMVLEKEFYEKIIGKPLEWIPIRSHLINMIEESIAQFDGIYSPKEQDPSS